MSIYIDDLRSMAQSGVPLCDLAADEIESIEEAYELLFKENAKLRQQADQQAQPVAEVSQPWGVIRWFISPPDVGTKLFTSPPAPQAREFIPCCSVENCASIQAELQELRAIRLAPDKPMRGKDFWITASQKENNHG